MDISFILEVFLIFILVSVNFILAASRTAVAAARKSRIRQLADKGSAGAGYVNRLREDPDGFFALIQMGTTLTAVAASMLAGILTVRSVVPALGSLGLPAGISGAVAFIVVTAGMSYILLVVGRLLSRELGIRQAERVALVAARPLYLALGWTGWINRILSGSVNLVLRMIGVDRRRALESSISDDEMITIVREGLERGTFERTEHEIIDEVLDFTETVVRTVMTPRIDILAVDYHAPTEDTIKTMIEGPYTRYPVYKENLDDIVGIVHIKEVVGLVRSPELIILDDLMREPYFVPESMPVAKLLREFQTRHLHMAIVLDEFGGTAGLITLEDILEELVGEIRDEYDREAEDLEQLPDGSFNVLASMSLRDFNDFFGTDFDEEEADTVGGYIVNALGEVPDVHQEARIGKTLFKIIEKKGHRIIKLHLTVESAMDEGRDRSIDSTTTNGDNE